MAYNVGMEKKPIGLVPNADVFAAMVAKESADAVAFLRVLQEEFVLAGYPGGDRNVLLANIRTLLRKARYK